MIYILTYIVETLVHTGTYPFSRGVEPPLAQLVGSSSTFELAVSSLHLSTSSSPMKGISSNVTEVDAHSSSHALHQASVYPGLTSK